MITPNDEDTLSELPEKDGSILLVADSGAATSVGLIRQANEDHFGATGQLFLVADGMGGTSGGALASRLTVEHLLQSDPHDGWVAVLSAVNDSVRNACTSAGHPSAGSTIVGLIVEDQRCVTLSVGDSRIYRFRDGELHQLTVDHNLGNLRREEGLDPSIGDERGKPRALTSYIGNPDGSQRLDVGTVSAQHGDRMLLTTDGVHEQLSSSQLSDLLQIQTCRAAANAIVDASNEAGGRDNSTAYVIELSTDASNHGSPSGSVND